MLWLHYLQIWKLQILHFHCMSQFYSFLLDFLLGLQISLDIGIGSPTSILSIMGNFPTHSDLHCTSLPFLIAAKWHFQFILYEGARTYSSFLQKSDFLNLPRTIEAFKMKKKEMRQRNLCRVSSLANSLMGLSFHMRKYRWSNSARMFGSQKLAIQPHVSPLNLLYLSVIPDWSLQNFKVFWDLEFLASFAQ